MKIKGLKEALYFNRYEFNKFMERNSYPETSPQFENWGKIIFDHLFQTLFKENCFNPLIQEMKDDLVTIQFELNNYKAQTLALKFIQKYSD